MRLVLRDVLKADMAIGTVAAAAAEVASAARSCGVVESALRLAGTAGVGQ
jgi:hypothetical protein